MSRLNSFVFYETYYNKVKALVNSQPELANELLLAIIEYGLYGEYDVDEKYRAIVDALLTEVCQQIDMNNGKYAAKLEATKDRRAIDKKLYEIAAMLAKGYKQKDIAAELGISAGEVSKRISALYKDYGEIVLEYGLARSVGK